MRAACREAAKANDSRHKPRRRAESCSKQKYMPPSLPRRGSRLSKAYKMTAKGNSELVKVLKFTQ